MEFFVIWFLTVLTMNTEIQELETTVEAHNNTIIKLAAKTSSNYANLAYEVHQADHRLTAIEETISEMQVEHVE